VSLAQSENPELDGPDRTLTVVAFMVLHLVAAMTSSPIKATAMADMGAVYIHTLTHTFAYFLQFIIPAGLLVGAIISLIKRKQEVVRFSDATAAPKIATSAAGFESPVCPRCGAAMVERKAMRGNSAGQKFCGCTTYPKCSGTRQI
jgi:hypothetical protein